MANRRSVWTDLASAGHGRLTAGVQVAALGQRDQLFDDRTQFLGFRQGGLDLLVFNQANRHMLANIALRCSWVRFSLR